MQLQVFRTQLVDSSQWSPACCFPVESWAEHGQNRGGTDDSKGQPSKAGSQEPSNLSGWQEEGFPPVSLSPQGLSLTLATQGQDRLHLMSLELDEGN
jgi:hypothetical protein